MNSATCCEGNKTRWWEGADGRENTEEQRSGRSPGSAAVCAETRGSRLQKEPEVSCAQGGRRSAHAKWDTPGSWNELKGQSQANKGTNDGSIMVTR